MTRRALPRRAVDRASALLVLLFRILARHLIVWLARFLARRRPAEQATATPTTVWSTVTASRLASMGAFTTTPDPGTAGHLAAGGRIGDVLVPGVHVPLGPHAAHPDSPVGRLRGAATITVNGVADLSQLPGDDLHRSTLALLAENHRRWQTLHRRVG